MTAERVVRLYVQLYLGKRPGRLPLFFGYVQSLQEAPVQGGVGLVGVEVTVLVKEDLGESELYPLVFAAVRDQGRKVKPAHPHVPVVLDRKRPHTLLARIPLSESLQKRVHERGVPYNLPLQTL